MTDWLPGPEDDAPPDTVPQHGMTREGLLALTALLDRDVELRTPGDVEEDVDGTPIGVWDTNVDPVVVVGGPIITQADADRLGLTDKELKNVRIIDAN